jgi:hypothetical protein
LVGLLYQSTWAATIKYHGLGRLNNKILFSYGSADYKFKIKVLVGSVFGEGSLPGYKVATLELHLH